MQGKISELRKEFLMLKTYEIKPNYSYLAKKYGYDPRTIKKYYEGYDGKPVSRKKQSSLDNYKNIIKEKLKLKGIKMTAIYFFLKESKDYKGSYSTLTYYIRKNFKDLINKKDDGVHIRFETEIGEQLQFDWVESISLINKYGEIFEFNIFSAELAYSRMHYFKYSKYKTREDVITCLIETFKYFGGTTKSILTDNMSSIVVTKDNKSIFCKEFREFAKDFNINLNKCKIKHPFTKGKVEVRNKFIKWLIPYNYEFETEEDIAKIIEKINVEANNRINSTTNMKPILLYQKEKEYLNSLPNKQIIEQYMNLFKPIKVQNTALINYKGIQYSVPPKYINKTLKIKENDNKLYIYNNTELIAMHDVSNKSINYKEQHYIECLKNSMPNKTEEELQQLAKKNLELFDNLTKKKEGKINE